MLKQNRASFVDTVFVTVLFCVFALCSFFLILIGAKVYRSSADSMDQAYETRTALTYVSTKLRHGDAAGAIQLYPLENGQSALRLALDADGETYYTYLYFYEGELCEALLSESQPFDPKLGEAIVALRDFRVVTVSDGLLECSVTSQNGVSESMRFAVRTGEVAS